MKMLLYCTKAKPYLIQGLAKPMHTLDTTNHFNYNWRLVNKGFSNDRLNGKIVAECDFEVEEIVNSKLFNNYATWKLGYDDLLKKSNLTEKELVKYLGTSNIPHKVYKQYSNNCGYAIHIKNLHIFDKPRELDDYEDDWEYPLGNAPQNMRYCFSTLYSNIEADIPIRTDSYILISIRPEWLCKILNGEKSIEVRRKVLKEMLK